ncbi:MAG: hypothetical protein ACQES4_11395, partial [Bacillota bacterium]
AVWHHRDESYFSGMGEEETLTGYEIHMGRTDYHQVKHPVYLKTMEQWEGAVSESGNVFGTYMHGIFDNFSWTNKLLNGLRRHRGLSEQDSPLPGTYQDFKEQEYDRLADLVRENLDMEQVYRIIKKEV